MRLNFFLKCLKFNLDSKNAMKKQQNVFAFLQNCIWIGNGLFSLSWWKYSSSSVNVLTSSPKILDLIKNDEKVG